MNPDFEAMVQELAALRKINRVLMDRVEKSVNSTGNAYAIFEQNILLQKRVEERTVELEQRHQQQAALLDEQKRIGEELRASEHRAAKQRSAIAQMVSDPDLLKGGARLFLPQIAEVLSETMGVARASIWLLSDDRANLICQTLYDARTRTQTSGAILETRQSPAYFKAILTDARIFAADAQSDARTCEMNESYLKPMGITSMLDAGIVVEGQLAGVVCLEHVGTRRQWHADEESFASAIAAIVAQLFINTERKRAETALRESEEKFRALFAAMTEMVVLHEVVLDELGQPVNYRITDCNRAFTEVTGIARAAAVGKLATEVYQTLVPPYLEEFSRVGSTGKPCHFETYFPPMDKHFFISVVSPGKNRFATISTDITEAKKIQHVIAMKNKELEQLVYVASHDLRSPLVNVDGYGRELEFAVGEIIRALEFENFAPVTLESLLRAQLPDITVALRHIRNSTRQMDALLKGLLKLSRLGRAALEVGPLNMNGLLARVTSTLQYQIREAGADVRVGSLPPCQGDDVQVVQIFANLIGNALKFRDPGRPCVLAVSGVVEPGRCVYCVADNGIGIPPEKQEKIFELFHRLDPAKTDGEGLGLTIVRQILGRLHGKIWVKSIPGEGSQFHVALPKESAAQM